MAIIIINLLYGRRVRRLRHRRYHTPAVPIYTCVSYTYIGTYYPAVKVAAAVVGGGGILFESRKYALLNVQ